MRSASEAWLRRPLDDALQVCRQALAAPSPAPSPVSEFIAMVSRAGVRRGPLSASWEIIVHCNLTCAHCYLEDEGAPRARRADTEQALAIVADLVDLGVLHLTISGGEPTLRRDLETIVAAAKARRMALTLQTNATRIDRARAEGLAAVLDPRVDLVQVSLDGARAETHDRIRGAGAFAAALAGIRELRGRLPVVISTCPTNVNQLELPEVYALAAELGAVAFQATPLAPFVAEQDALRPEPDLLFLAEAEILRRASAPGAPLYLGGVSGELLHWVSHAKARQQLGPAGPACPERLRCGGALTKIHLTADGRVFPCVFAVNDALVMGNCLDRSLREIWADRHGHPFTRGRDRDALACGRCPWVSACKGGCPGLALAREGTLDAPDPRCEFARGRL